MSSMRRKQLSTAILVFGAYSFVALGQTNVLTYHNDLARTGQNISETILTPAKVSPPSFGKLFTVPVDGKVDAQPLYVSAVPIPGHGSPNVVFAATEHDSVYAFDASNGAVYWHVSLLQSGETPSDNRGCGQVTPEIGITATPVIDPTSGPHGTIYLVAMSKDSLGNYFQRLHALDITTGAEEFGGAVAIQASYPGTGDNSSNGQIIFDPKQYKSRPGLLLLNGVVYTSWGSHCDIRPYTGWIIGYNSTTLRQTSVLNLAPNGNAAALWNSGGAPAADAQGNIFVSLGNGTFDTTTNAQGFPTRGDYGNAFVKVTPQNGSLMPTDYWTMDNTASESNGDIDLGSGGIMLLPDMLDAAGAVRHLAVGAGKDTNLWVLDCDNMGKFDPQANATIYQELTGALPGGIWSNPAYFNDRVYFGPVGDVIRAFQLISARLSSLPVSTTATVFPYPGATPSISANGTANAILWAVENSNPAVLHAYDANNLGLELYNSNQASGGRDQFGPGNKYITPTVANGEVFVGTTDSVAAFGLLAPTFTLVPGSLQQVSVGGDGTVWGINAAGLIFQYNSASQSWVQVPGFLTQIAVGSNGSVWGLNPAGLIYRWDVNRQNWTPVSGTLAQITVGSDGDVWGLNSADLIYHWSPSGQNWVQIPGTLKQIAVGFNGAVWGINSAGLVYRFNPGLQAFVPVAGSLTQIAVGSDGVVWGLSGQSIYRFNSLTQQFEHISGGLTHIAVGSGGNVWGVNSGNLIYRFDTPSQSWVNVPGTLTQIAAGANGSVWGLNSSNAIYSFNQPLTSSQIFHPVPGAMLTQIAAGIDGNAWGIGPTDKLYGYNLATQTWAAFNPSNAFSEVAVGFGQDVWALGTNQTVFHFDPLSQTFLHVPGFLTEAAVGANGDMWGVTSGHAIYRYDLQTQGFTSIPGDLVHISVGADGTVWGVNSASSIYRFDSPSQTWMNTPGNLTSISVGSAGSIWGINAGSSIYAFDVQAQSWQNIPGTLMQLSVGFDDGVWGVNGGGLIYRYDPASATSWDNIPGLLKQISVSAQSVIWGVNAAGAVYRFY
jgi:Tectonin domain